MENRKILVSITSKGGIEAALAKLKEIKKFQVEEAALFLTMLDLTRRKELYGFLDKSGIKRIPHVHLRHDCEEWEVEYLIEKYNTQVFNIHGSEEYQPADYLTKYRDMVFVENLFIPQFEEDLNQHGGMCIYFSHWEGMRLEGNSEYDEGMLERVKKFPIGCAHISAVKKTKHPDPAVAGRMQYDDHYFEDLSEFDYMKKYIEYLPKYSSIELESSIEEQLRVKEYLEKIINQ